MRSLLSFTYTKPMKTIKSTLIILLYSIISASCSSGKITSYEYENGFVKFNTIQNSDKWGYIYGHLEVVVYQNWIEVAILDGNTTGERHWIIPREKVIYIGKKIEK